MPKYDLGRKPSETKEISPPSEKEIYYPSINVNTEDIKGLDLKMGEKVKLIGIVSARNEHKRDDEKKEVRYEIDIKQLNKGYTEEEYSAMSDDEKDDADAKDLEEKAEKKEE